MAAREPQNGRRGLESGLGFWRSHQLLINKSFDPNTPSMRKGDDGGNGGGGETGEKKKEKKGRE